MSRIGKQPIVIPKGVTFEHIDARVLVRGAKGEVSVHFPEGFSLVQEQEGEHTQMIVKPDTSVAPELSGRTRAFWGLAQRLLRNSVVGVTEGFSRKLLIEGVGYRAEMKGKDLVLHLGFSHPVNVVAPENIQFTVEKNTTIIVSGIDKYLVGQMAANIRKHRKPEPYKGKGIRYEGEHVRRKAGKKAA